MRNPDIGHSLYSQASLCNCQVDKGMGSQLAVVSVAKYPGGESRQ